MSRRTKIIWNEGAGGSTIQVHRRYECVPMADGTLVPIDPGYQTYLDKLEAEQADPPVDPRMVVLVLLAGRKIQGLAISAADRWWAGACALAGFAEIDRTTHKEIQASFSATGLMLNPGTSGYQEDPVNGYEIVEDGGIKWWQTTVSIPWKFAGDAQGGWIDACDLVGIAVVWSRDGQTWEGNVFYDLEGEPITYSGLMKSITVRSSRPVDWEEKTVDFVFAHLPPDRYASYTTTRDITALKINGATITLPNYPYTMPAQSAALLADLDAAGYYAIFDHDPGDHWSITLAGIETTGYAASGAMDIDPPMNYLDDDDVVHYLSTLPATTTNWLAGEYLQPVTPEPVQASKVVFSLDTDMIPEAIFDSRENTQMLPLFF